MYVWFYQVDLRVYVKNLIKMRKLLLLVFITVFSFTTQAQLTVTPGDSSMCAGDTLSYTSSGMVILAWVDTLNQDTAVGSAYNFTTSVVGTHTIYAVGINLVPADTDTIGINITVNANPMASIMSSAGNMICAGSSTELVAMPSIPGNTYLWAPGSLLDTTGGDTVLASPTQDTTFTLLVTNTNGCSSEASLLMMVSPSPNVTITSSATVNNNFICDGGSATLTAVATGVASYEWSPIATLSDSATMTVIASPINNTTYTVVVTDSNGCTDNATILVRVNKNPPTIVFQPTSATICQGSSIFIDVLSTGNTYSWTPTTGVSNPTAQDVTLTPNSTTTYTLAAEKDACISTSQITITVKPAPVISVAQTGGDASLCLDETAEITATCANCVSYVWSFPNSTLSTSNPVQSVSPNQAGIIPITVQGVDPIGCTRSATVNLNVDSCFVGTPFGIADLDGLGLTIFNEGTRVVFETETPISEVSLFNILGEQVAQTSTSGSTATVDKSSLASGVYIAQVLLANGEVIVRKIYLQ